MQISIDSDLPKLGLFASDMHRRQMPFATKQAINKTAFSVRKHTVERVFPTAFQMRNKRFGTASLRVETATKTNLRASVFDKLQRGNLAEHAEGGSKTPRGKHIAVPSKALAKRRSGRGVPKSQRPRAALSKPDTFKTTINGQLVIARRKGKKRKIEVLYVLEQRAKIRRTFPFYTQAQIVTDREFGQHFDKEFEKAVRTAKPRRRGV